jgi:hypothetical protein
VIFGIGGFDDVADGIVFDGCIEGCCSVGGGGLGFSVDLVVGISCGSEVVFGAGDDVAYCVVGGFK